jgi:hypothetical protein
MNNNELNEEEEIEYEKLSQELDDYIEKSIKNKKIPNFKPVTDVPRGFFEYPDNIEPYITESGDLMDDSNPFDDNE